MRFLREMRQSLQDGCGCDENAQPYRVHPLRNVHPRLSDERRVLPLRLQQRERNTKENNDGGIKMNMKKIFALAFAVLMMLALAACGRKNYDKMGDMSGNGSAMTGEPKTAEEALTLHKELLARENAILSENTELWENVFMEAEKGMAMIEDGKNYGVLFIYRKKYRFFVWVRNGWYSIHVC